MSLERVLRTPPMFKIVTCTLGTVRVEFGNGMIGQLYPMGTRLNFTNIIGLKTRDARNLAMQQGLDAGVSAVIMYDDDMIPRSRSAIALLISAMGQNPDIGIIGGVYPKRAFIPDPLVIKTYGEGPWWGWEDGEIHKVFCTGTGFTAYRSEAMKSLDLPTYEVDLPDGTAVTVKDWFGDQYATDDIDLGFKCDAAGIGWYVEGSVVCDQIEKDGGLYQIEKAKKVLV